MPKLAGWHIFDWAFGLGLPLVGLGLDPLIFKLGGLISLPPEVATACDLPLLWGGWWGYGFMGLGLLLLGCWLGQPRRWQLGAAFFVGFFVLHGLNALWVGLEIPLTLSARGVVNQLRGVNYVLLGSLVAWAQAVVYLRQGYAAAQVAQKQGSQRWGVGLMALGVGLGLLVPFLLHLGLTPVLPFAPGNPPCPVFSY